MKLVSLVLPIAALAWSVGIFAKGTPSWTPTSTEQLRAVDDDIGRNVGARGFFDNVLISEIRFGENGFYWHLIRFASTVKSEGPLWVVPHDDENAAFDAMIAAIKDHGGVGIAVNSGPGSLRLQAGNGICGVGSGVVSTCDPNRNFDEKTRLFTSVFLNQLQKGQPVIALHTNAPGFNGDGHGGRGEITVLDRQAASKAETRPRAGAILAVNPQPIMANHDTLGLTAYLARDAKPYGNAEKCGREIASSGIHFWHERVRDSDGSMSNYLILNRPEIPYFNAESRAEVDLALSAARHRIMVAAYLAKCVKSGDKPAP